MTPTNFKILSLALSLSGKIICPLIVLGGIGYLLDNKLNTKPIVTLIGLATAFLVSIGLLILTAKAMLRETKWKSR